MYSMWSMYVGYVNMNVHQNCLHVCVPWWRYLPKRTLSSTIVCGSKLECVFLTLTLTLNFQEQVQEIATDPEKWKQAMFNAKKQIEKLREQRDAIRSKTKGTYVCYVCR